MVEAASWRRNHAGPEEESWRRNPGGGGSMEVDAWKRNYGEYMRGGGDLATGGHPQHSTSVI